MASAAVTATSPTGEVSISTPGPVLSGVASTYTVTITNNTSQPDTSTGVGIQLPTDLKLGALDPNCQRTNTSTLPGTAISCGWTSLAPGQSVSATFSATAATPGTDTISVNGTLFFGSFTPARDSVNLAVPVSPGPTDIQVTGSSNNGSPPVGSPFNYTFQVKDNGPQGAYGVTFDNPLPPSLTPVSFSTDTGTCTSGASAGSVHCDLGNLATGAQATIVITAIPSVTGSITDTASVGMLGPDLKPANNSVSVTVQPK